MNQPPPPPLPPEQPYQPVPAPSQRPKWVLWGCGGCLGLLVLGGAALFAIFYFGMAQMKKSDAYTKALELARNSPAVQEALGTPIEDGWMVQGSAKAENNNRQLDLQIPLTGPKGKGNLRVAASATVDQPWTFSQMEVVLPDNRTVNLLEPETPELPADALLEP